MQADAKTAEIVAALEYDGVFVEVQTNGTGELLPQVVSRCSASGHFRGASTDTGHNTSAAGSEIRGTGGKKGARFVLRHRSSRPIKSLRFIIPVSFLSLSDEMSKGDNRH